MGARTADPRRKVLDSRLPGLPPDSSSRWLNSAISGATSFVVHLVLLLILACLLVNFPRSTQPDAITVSFEPKLETELDDPLVEIEGQITLESEDPFASSVATAALQPEFSRGMPLLDLKSEATSSETGSDELVVLQPMLVPIGGEGRRARHEQSGGRRGVADDWNFPAGVGYEGRQPGSRTQLALLNGGTLASERAVDRGLEWLARHQWPDGSWNFQHRTGDCNPDCDGPGKIEGRTAATGLALLCFLGAGHTHRDDGPWQDTVKRGLEWLTDQSRTGDLRCSADRAEPEHHSGMYAQGIATMALCEAVGMTHDRVYLPETEAAVQFIIDAQDRYGGGWRYEPNQPGDTSHIGWQVMALVSARMSGIDVPDITRERTVVFLEFVHIPSTDQFGYTDRSRGTTATTAIGQLCSMYLRSSLPPQRIRMSTAPLLADNQLNNSYSNYYVTQVLYQIGGPSWETWNETLRDGLVRTQETKGHAAGSWDPRGRWSNAGGRLYTTAMHVLTLEVYYRHLPLYQRDAFEALQPELAENRRRREPTIGRDRPRQTDDRDEHSATVEPTPPKDPQPELLRDPNVPTRYILNYPTADRFCGPIESTFEDAERDFVYTDRGRKVGQHPNGGFGLPMLKVGGQPYFHSGADYGWYQTGASVHAVAAGIVRLSVDPRLARLREAGVEPPDQRQNVMDWGSMIVIEHRLPDGEYITTLYAHLGLDRLVQAGDIVAAGQQIGTIGSKDAAINGGYEPHLHFGVREGRIAEAGASLFTLPHEGLMLVANLVEPGEQTMTVRFPVDVSVPLGMVLEDRRAVHFEQAGDGLYRVPSWILWQSIPPEAQLVGNTPDLEGWRDPTAFLREHQATVLPAVRFALTPDTQPNGFPNMAGEPAPGWIIDEWLREPAGGVDVSQLRGKTIVMLCVQNNCRPSLLLALPTLADAARRFEDADDVVLILHQTVFTDFRFNTSLRFRQLLNQLPPNIAVAHSGDARARPVILDDYGVRGTPWTLIIGPDGTVEFSGCLVDSNELIRFVEELRGEAMASDGT